MGLRKRLKLINTTSLSNVASVVHIRKDKSGACPQNSLLAFLECFAGEFGLDVHFDLVPGDEHGNHDNSFYFKEA